jgi:replicative DNA helicase
MTMQEPVSPDIYFGNTTEFLQTLPFSKEAEQSVLGGLMLNNAAWMTIADLLTENDFYHREHQLIFRAIQTLAEEGHPCDPITLSEWLENNNKLEVIGGNSYLGLLAKNTPSAANIEAYAKIVREHSILRQLVRVGTEIMESAFNTQGRTSAQLLDEAEKKVFAIAELGAKGQGGFVKIKEVLSTALEQIDKLSQQQGHITGIPTGFNGLDKKISGLQRSDLIIIAGRPSMGKCLAGQAKIVDSTGKLITIEEIYYRHQIELLTLSANGQFQLTKPTVFVTDGIKPVFRLTTQLGRSVETTLNHPYLTLEGWKSLTDLVVGEKIAVPRQINIFGITTLTEGQINLLATIVANSCFSDYNLLVKVLSQWVTQINARDLDKTPYSNHLSHFFIWFHQQGLSWLQQLGVWNNQQQLLFIPTIIFTLPRAQLALFLNHLFIYTGWLNRTLNHFKSIGYRLNHEELARQIQHLLLRFGVIAAIKPHQHHWLLVVEQIDSLKIFVSEIGLLQPPNHGVVTQSPEIYWDEIAAIEFSGQKPVYDLTIADTHNFVANDICVHNTSLAMNIAENVALHSQLPVAVFSMEMSNEQLAMRLIASLARINLQKVRTGKLDDDDWPKLATAISRLQETTLFIDDTPALNPTELRARVRRLAREQGELGLVVIDYLQLMQIADNKENRAVEVSEISRSLKALAKELNVPVIALSQLNRSLEQRPDKRPRMADLRESGSIEQDSDLIIFIYRDEVYNDKSEHKGIAEVIIAKQRNGPIGSTQLTFLGEFTKFENHVSEDMMTWGEI